MVVDIETRAQVEAKVIRYRRMPALFPATEAPSDLQITAEEYLDTVSLPDGDHAAWIKVMANFAEDLLSRGNPSDGDKQRACDEAHGHVLKVDGNDITCTTCSARWQGVPY